MSRLIKVIDNETIEIADYRNPEAIFKSSQNPPTLQDTKNEIEHLEWYCTFKDTINPFQMYEENHRLHSIIKEVREYLKFLKEHYEELRTSPVEDSYFINDMLRQMFIQSIENYLVGIEDILDKESINEENK